MSDVGKTSPGAIAWIDLTVPDATGIRDFYRDVIGWKINPVDMGGYDDFCMLSPVDGRSIAGICHARGINADLPPLWLVYVVVEDVDASAKRARELGGQVLVGPRELGEGRFCVVRDPAGAALALYQVCA